MSWTASDVETAALLLAAVSIAAAGVTTVFLRNRVQVSQTRRDEFRARGRGGRRELLVQFGPGAAIAIVAGLVFAFVNLPLTMALALAILAGAAAAVGFVFASFELALWTSLRIQSDLDHERAARAGRAPIVGGLAMSLAAVGVGLALILGAYFLSNGAVTQVIGVAIGVSLVALTAVSVRWVRRSRKFLSPSRDVGGARVGRLLDGTMTATDLMATLVAAVAAAMLVAYRDPIPSLSFPNAIVYPAAVAGIGVVATLSAGAFLIRARARPAQAGTLFTFVLLVVGVSLVAQLLFAVVAMNANLGIFLSGAMGTLAGGVAMIAFAPSAARRPQTLRASGARGKLANISPVLIAGPVALGTIAGAYWFSSRLVVVSGAPPILDVGLYGVGLAAAAITTLIGPALLMGSIGVLQADAVTAAAAERDPSRSATTLELFQREGAAPAPTNGAFVLVASAFAATGLLVADWVAISNVLGQAVGSLPMASFANTGWAGVAGLAFGVSAAAVFGWAIARGPASSPARRGAWGRGAGASARKVAVAVLPLGIASIGSVGMAWALGLNALIGFGVGLIVVGLPIGLARCRPSRHAPAEPDTSDSNLVALSVAGVLRTTLLLAVGVILPFAVGITSCYLCTPT